MGKHLDAALKDLNNTLTHAMNDIPRFEQNRIKRRLEIHPSGFPYCPLREFYELINMDYSPVSDVTFAGTYFVNVGTLVHTLIQEYMGKTGKVWGLWHCSNAEHGCDYKVTKGLATYHKCPKCGGDLSYDEIGYRLADTLQGHQDCLFEDKDGNFWVVDYKTCLLSKAIKHAGNGTELDGNNTYRAQQEAYVTLCQKRYTKFFKKKGKPFNVRGYVLVYMPRDIPFQFQFVANEVSDERKEEVWEMIGNNIEDHNTILDATSFDDIKHLIDTKPCKSMKDYAEKMASPYHECPLLPVCFVRRQLENTLRNEADDSVLLPLRETLTSSVKAQTVYFENFKET